MARRKLIRSTEFPYHITARTNNKEPFPIALTFVWKIMSEELYALQALHDFRIHAFTLMPNHFHLVASTPSCDLGSVMCELQTKVSKRINAYANRSGHIFGGPYYQSIITSTRYYGHVFKYVYRNPVKAGLSSKVEEYEFSTARGIFESGVVPFPIHYTNIGLEVNLPDDTKVDGYLEWLNRPFPQEAELSIQKLLRKQVIKELLTRSDRKPNKELARFL